MSNHALFEEPPSHAVSVTAAGRMSAGGMSATTPLAARMRPRTLDEYVGQEALLAPGKPLRAMLDQQLRSVILWGPPGVGKTSLAQVIARHADAVFTELSAVTAGVKDVRRVIDEGRGRRELRDRATILFIDEIHRFNKSQQDALLPGVEAGWVTLVGATTENPYFELNAPLLSRCQLLRLTPLSEDNVRELLARACADPDRGFGGMVELTPEAIAHMVHIADGDARTALGALEIAVQAAGEEADGSGVVITVEQVADAMQRLRYDKSADGHYDQVSAFIKSMRGSDPDAAVYWLLRMLESGEDPRFLARRMVIFASEDIGLADRQALPVAVAAFEALDRVGLPEARYALVQVTVMLATAPKSNSVARALSAGLDAVRRFGNADVPVHLRDAHYRGARDLGHGAGYDYPHDDPSGFAAAQTYLPDVMYEGDGRQSVTLYEPSVHGHEGSVGERVKQLRSQAVQARRRRGRGAGAGDRAQQDNRPERKDQTS
ncbi:MAG: replication-associated recombination protein A [Nitriliruptoraceae bacterium]